ncbi:carbohydrate ABC transporter permease [Plantactinospora soyae]|uniref:Multiple sugar transport system permease protein n=1 Tax=Plantactinospora soyae TaxID=1544732 RepID=A0A927MC65_9ACTN|nr:carbohydrate ABC transporter permease [Plantactinospora soyae]MBE1491887.1 multiple sugar transport system permease protein [Plantactinospora soyae]
MTERPSRRGRRFPVGSYLAAVVFAVPFLLPFYLLLRNSLMTQAELGALEWHWWPEKISFTGFTDAFDNSTVPLGRALLNSALVAVISAPVSTLLASMTGYAVARIRVAAARPVFVLVVATMMVPGAATFVPTFVVVGSMGGVNTLWGLIVPGLFNALAVLLFRGFYLRFPQEIEDAGRIDGLGHLGVYLRLALPNSAGLLAALGVLSFIEHWNSFLWPLVIGQDPAFWTVQVAMSTNLTSQAINLPALFASAVISVIPLALVFLAAQRYIVRGIMATGIKG